MVGPLYPTIHSEGSVIGLETIAASSILHARRGQGSPPTPFEAVVWEVAKEWQQCPICDDSGETIISLAIFIRPSRIW